MRRSTAAAGSPSRSTKWFGGAAPSEPPPASPRPESTRGKVGSPLAPLGFDVGSAPAVPGLSPPAPVAPPPPFAGRGGFDSPPTPSGGPGESGSGSGSGSGEGLGTSPPSTGSGFAVRTSMSPRS